MRWFQWSWLVAAVLTLVAACSSSVGIQADQEAAARRLARGIGQAMPLTWNVGGGTGTIVGSVRPAAFAVQAAAKTVGDVSYYVFQLYNVTTASVTASVQTSLTSIVFNSVAAGTYQMRAEAFGAGSVSITQGGQQVSLNTATVAGATVAYSSGGALAVTVNLLSGTGESVAKSVTVTPGLPFAGSPVGQSWSLGAVLGSFAVGADPEGMAIDPAGNVWVANEGSGTLTKLASNGAALATVPAGTNSWSVELDGQNQPWVVDYTTSKVYKFDTTAALLGSVAVAADPRGIAFDRFGQAWVTSNGSTNLTVLSPSLAVVATYTMPATTFDIAFDSVGNAYVTHDTTNSLSKVSPTGVVQWTVATAGGSPEGVTVDLLGCAWVSVNSGNRVQRFNGNGTSLWATAVTSPEAIAIMGDGRGAAACNNGSVVVLDANGVVTGTFPIGTNLSDIVFDGGGDAWVADGLGVVKKVQL